MLALTWRSGGMGGAMPFRLAEPVGDYRVLPRFLRRPVRLMVALATGRQSVPRHTGLAAAAALYGATGLYGMALGGHTAEVMQALTAASGFAIEDIRVSGHVQTSEIDVLQRVGLDGSTSLLTLDAGALRQALLQLPWVADATVRKDYPNAIEIVLTEREPFGLWQHGDTLAVIEPDGDVIAPYNNNRFAELPLYVGVGADQAAAAMAAVMAEFPALKQRVKAYVRVGDRRWDLVLDNGVRVSLPEGHARQALAELVALDRERELLARDIAAVDMRLADRLTIRLTPAAMERREKALEQRAKMLKQEQRT